MLILVGAGRVPEAAHEAGGTGAMAGPGRLGAAVGKSEGMGLFAKRGVGVGGRGGNVGKQTASHLPPSQDDVACGAFLLRSERLFSLPRETGKR